MTYKSFLFFQQNFSSLSDYISYEYVNQSESPSLDNRRKRNISITFPDSVDIEDGQYRLIYFQSTGTRGVTGLAGMSEVFRAEKKCPSPRLESID